MPNAIRLDSLDQILSTPNVLSSASPTFGKELYQYLRVSSGCNKALSLALY